MDQPNPQLSETPRPISYRPILITFVSAILLTGGSFFGCAKTLNFSGRPSPWNTVFFWSFLLFAALTAGAFVWLVVAIIINLVRDAREVRKGGF